MWFRLALKELRYSWKQMITVAAILFVGFVGPLIAASLSSSTDTYLRVKAREMLSADLALRSLRPITDEEVETARQTLSPRAVARETEFDTMASRAGEAKEGIGAGSTLTEIRAVDENFPIYGQYRVRTATSGPEGELKKTSELQGARKAWVFPEVLVQLNLELGERVRIGEAEFVVEGEVLDGPGVLRAGFGFAPSIYIGREFVAATGLSNFGSRISHRVYFLLPEVARLEDAGTLLKAALPDPDLFLRTPDDSIQGMERFIQFFHRYIAVVTLIVFALSWMSAFYILEIFLTDRLRQAAVLVTLGGSRLMSAGLQILQLIVVSLIALSFGLVLVTVGFALANRVFSASWPEGFWLSVHWQDVVRLAAIAVLSSISFTVPLLLKLARLQPRALLDESSMGADTEPSSRWSRLLFYLPLMLLFWILAVWLMESWQQGSWLVLGLLGTTLLGWSLGRALFRLLFGLLKNSEGLPRLAATNLSRGRFGTSLCFLALTLVALVLNLVPHLLTSAVEEIQPREGRSLPALFLFNIPEGAVQDLEKFANTNGAELRYLSPLILARVEKVNGLEPVQERMQKFPVRISFRDKLIPSETVIKGESIKVPFDADKQAEPWISMEARFAERNDFRLGDLIEFDVQGVPVTGRVKNFRRVKWTDFHPNFFMEFQPGVLEDAPKTFLANIHLADAATKARFQFDLVRNFPDLSVVDIGRTIERIIVIADAMVGPIQAVAWLAVFMSILILFVVVGHNLRMRSGELDVMKLLGADAPVIRKVITFEYAAIGTLAALSGAGFATLTSHFVSRNIFDIPSRFSTSAIVLSCAVIIIVSSGIALFATNRILSHSTITKR